MKGGGKEKTMDEYLNNIESIKSSLVLSPKEKYDALLSLCEMNKERPEAFFEAAFFARRFEDPRYSWYVLMYYAGVELDYDRALTALLSKVKIHGPRDLELRILQKLDGRDPFIALDFAEYYYKIKDMDKWEEYRKKIKDEKLNERLDEKYISPTYIRDGKKWIYSPELTEQWKEQQHYHVFDGWKWVFNQELFNQNQTKNDSKKKEEGTDSVEM